MTGFETEIQMDLRNKLSAYGKRNITLEDLTWTGE